MHSWSPLQLTVTSEWKLQGRKGIKTENGEVLLPRSQGGRAVLSVPGESHLEFLLLQ